MKADVENHFEEKPKKYFFKGFGSLYSRYEKCISYEGNYIEKYKIILFIHKAPEAANLSASARTLATNKEKIKAKYLMCLIKLSPTNTLTTKLQNNEHNYLK